MRACTPGHRARQRLRQGEGGIGTGTWGREPELPVHINEHCRPADLRSCTSSLKHEARKRIRVGSVISACVGFCLQTCVGAGIEGVTRRGLRSGLYESTLARRAKGSHALVWPLELGLRTPALRCGP